MLNNSGLVLSVSVLLLLITVCVDSRSVPVWGGDVIDFVLVAHPESEEFAPSRTFDYFGYDVSRLGDLDGDGVEDLGVTSLLDDDGGSDAGAIFIMFMNANGTYKSYQKISMLHGNFSALGSGDYFGKSIALIDDLDQDGIREVAVGAALDSESYGFPAGAVYILFLNRDGTVRKYQKITEGVGNLTGLESQTIFGSSITSISDLDGDGINEIAVGATRYIPNNGSVWILFLNRDGTVKRHHQIHPFSFGVAFGLSLTVLPDLDNDGFKELVIGSPYFDGDRGAIFIVYLNRNATVRHFETISSDDNGLGTIPDSSGFGQSVSNVGDLDNDGTYDLMVGTIHGYGSIWILFMNSNATVKRYVILDNSHPLLSGQLGLYDQFGHSVTILELNDNGPVLVVGAPFHEFLNHSDTGKVYIFSLNYTYIEIEDVTTTEQFITSDIEITEQFTEETITETVVTAKETMTETVEDYITTDTSLPNYISDTDLTFGDIDIVNMNLSITNSTLHFERLHVLNSNLIFRLPSRVNVEQGLFISNSHLQVELNENFNPDIPNVLFGADYINGTFQEVNFFQNGEPNDNLILFYDDKSISIALQLTESSDLVMTTSESTEYKLPDTVIIFIIFIIVAVVALFLVLVLRKPITNRCIYQGRTERKFGLAIELSDDQPGK